MANERGPGRPRSERADAALKSAALALLAEEGWDGLTMEGIAARAAVSKATLYRRWEKPESVVRAAVAGLVTEGIPVPDTGTIAGDLRQLMREAVALYRGPAGGLMPALVAGMARDPALAEAVRSGFLAERRAVLRLVLERGIERGEVRADADLELALDFLGGPLFYRLLVTGGSIDEGLATGVVEVMLCGLSAA